MTRTIYRLPVQQQEVDKKRRELADQLLDSVHQGSTSGVERVLAQGGEV